jgi:hypothetical protein
MEKIYSKIYPEKLLHIIVKKSDILKGRNEIVPVDNYIQCGMLNMDKGKTFPPHKHIWKNRTQNIIAQESWVCIQGAVQCFFYDIDDSFISSFLIHSGDTSFTLEGGHTYEILEDDTLVYEYKTGPYEGQEFDKTFINDIRK